MDHFDHTNPPHPAPAPRAGIIWNLLTALTLLSTLCLGSYFLILFINPLSALNPLPPATPARLFLPTFTATPLQLQATWTPTSTIQPTPSDTPRPTFTPVFTSTPFSLIPTTVTPLLSPTATPIFPYTASITALESAPINGQGCDWLGVAGSADDLNNSPILYLRLRLGGVLGSQVIDQVTVTGIAPQYGRAGFEFVLGNKPIASNKTLWIQLFDQSGLEQSEKVYFDTYDSCKKNLILIRFKKIR
jgi:hypothetical protein